MSNCQFPILRAAQHDPTELDAAIEQVFGGIEAGTIRRHVLRNAKRVLDGAVCDAWKKHVREPYFHCVEEVERQPVDVRRLYSTLSMLSLHEVIRKNRKIGDAMSAGPVDAMRSFYAEVLPLAQAVASLHDKVDTVVKTCPVCFRPIAVLRGTMAHHGYQRPEFGEQTASCPGVRFKPFEVSSEGLEWLIATLRERLEKADADYRERDKKEGLRVFVATGTWETVGRDSPLWAPNFQRYVQQLESEIVSLNRELPLLEAKLHAWKPEEFRS